jgi:septal ring factor EnvC (AmiA/AmiB activator)
MAEAPEPKPDEAIAALEEQVAALKSRIEELIVERDVSRTKYYAAEKSEEETRAQFADLKERLATAEQLNSEMRGYLKRVQEDDAFARSSSPSAIRTASSSWCRSASQRRSWRRRRTVSSAARTRRWPTPDSAARSRGRGTGSRTDVLVHAGHPHAGLRSLQLPAFEGNHGQPESL